MKKTKMKYFADNDIIHLLISDEDETNSVEISPNITAELNDKGELIGIEILEASIFLRDFILENVQCASTKIKEKYKWKTSRIHQKAAEYMLKT